MHRLTEIIDELEKLRQEKCAYVGRTCDCKYIDSTPEPKRTGEQTGCCEMRGAIARLKEHGNLLGMLDTFRVSGGLQHSGMCATNPAIHRRTRKSEQQEPECTCGLKDIYDTLKQIEKREQ